MSIFGGFWPFAGMDGQQIYDNFQEGEGGKGLTGASDIVRGMSHKYEKRAESITQLTVRMEQAWEGPAGGVARRGAGPIAVEHGYAAPAINDASVTLKDQVSAFSDTKRVVEKPPPEPKEPSGLENFVSLGGAGRSYDQKKAEYDATNQTNVSAMGVYEDMSSTNSSRMPLTYGSLTSDSADVGVEQRTPPPIGPPPIGKYPPPGGGGNGSGNTGGTTGSQGTGGSQQYPPPGSNTGGGNDTTLPSQNNPPRQPPYDPTLPPGGRPPGRGGQQDVPVGPMGPGGYGQNGGQGGGPGGRGGSGFGPRGTGGFGPGGSGGAGSGPGGRGGGGFGPGGAGAAAAAEGGPARGGIGGAPGAAGGGGRGGGGMGGAGGRGQNGDEDENHERPSFLVEPDPHETFGTDQVTAPPVIGE